MNSSFAPIEFENVCGGLRTKILPSKNVIDVEIPEETLDNESHCNQIHEFEKWHWSFDDDRRHHRLINEECLEFYAAFYAQPIFKHKITQYDWNIHCNLHKPDPTYVHFLNQAVTTHLKSMEYHMLLGQCSQMDNFSLADCLFNVKWLYPVIRRNLFIYIAKLLRNQGDLKNVLLENCHLRLEEGFRFLLTLALTVGETLEKLYLWHFFVKGVMPLYIGYREDMKDPYLLTADLKLPVSQQEKQRIWDELIMDEIGYDLPHDYFYFFTVFLKSFTNLTVIYVHYNWMSIGQGIGLNLLGCLRNGNLRDLYLLCTKEDMPYNSGSRVAPVAWYAAKKKCPKLNVHLVALYIGDSYDDNLTLLQDEMPLTSYFLKTGLPTNDYSQVKEPWFDCILRTLIHKFDHTLRRLHLEVWYTRQRVDVMLTRCITELPILEEFVFSGAFDKIDTIREMCIYLLSYKTKLKRLKLLIQEDPCYPTKYQLTAKELESDYKQQLYDRGINFSLGTQIV